MSDRWGIGFFYGRGVSAHDRHGGRGAVRGFCGGGPIPCHVSKLIGPFLRRGWGRASLWLVFAGLAGCHPSSVRQPLAPLSMAEAAAIVNANSAALSTTLRAVGPVDGHVTTEKGRKRSFHLSGVLFYRAPLYFRFDLKSLGGRQMLLGTNAQWYWLYSKAEDRYYCGRQGIPGDLPADFPVQPEQILEALGLRGIPLDRPSSPESQVVQRIVGDYQQVLFLARDDQGRLFLEKEYWLDRYAPRLIRRVVFRNPDGQAEMVSKLDEYRPLFSGGPYLPGVLTADWPRVGTRLRFRARRWEAVPRVTPQGPQFATPAACRP